MATKTIIISEEYKNKLFHLDDFSGGGTTTKHPLAPVDTEGQVTFTARVSNRLDLGRYTISGGNTLELRSGQSFLSENFYEGQRLNLVRYDENNYSFDVEDISSDGTIMIVNNIILVDDNGVDGAASPLPNGTFSEGVDQDVLRSLTVSDGLTAKSAFIPNGSQVNFSSLLDDKEQSYIFEGLRPGGSGGRRSLPGVRGDRPHESAPGLVPLH